MTKKKTSKLRKAAQRILPIRIRHALKSVVSASRNLTSPRSKPEKVLFATGQHSVKNPFPHLIVTRMMIGVSRPTAFNLHARILSETLLPSLTKQTFQDFHWVIVTDRLIDPASRRFLERATSEYPNIHIETLDPFEQWTNVPDLGSMCRRYLGTTQNVITTRIDDDDALRLDFLEQVQLHARDAVAPLVSISYRNGVTVASDVRRYRMISSSAGASAGMSLLSPDVEDRNVHSSGHNGLHASTERNGGVALHLASLKPYFLSGEHGTSDSRERRNEQKAQKRLAITYTSAEADKAAYADLLASFGLPPDFDDRINAIRRKHADHAPPLFTYTPGSDRALSRLGLKRMYLNRASALHEKKQSATPTEREKIELEIHLLKQAHYLV